MDNSKVSLFRKYLLISFFLLLTIFRTISYFNFRGTDCDSDWLKPIFPCQWFNVTFELILWIPVILLFSLELIWEHDLKRFLLECKKFWPIFIFVFLALSSLIWSILPGISLYKFSILLMSTILAIYSGYQLDNERLFSILFWFLVGICIANLVFMLFFPGLGMWGGLKIWNGIFWHKIYLGAFMTLSIVIFLLKLFDWKNSSIFVRVINCLVLPASVFLLIMSNSMTGVITSVIIVFICLIFAYWIRRGINFKSIQFFLVLGTGLLFIIIVLLNLDHIFILLGRKPTLSGRIPMWTYLLQNAVSQRPILGFGYGAFWNLEGFRNDMTAAMGFTLQVTQSDNGLMEILLHLGIAGLAIILALFILGLVRAVKFFIKKRTMYSAFPLIFLLFALIMNSTVSFLLETDCFVWAVAIASQVAIDNSNNRGFSNQTNLGAGLQIDTARK